MKIHNLILLGLFSLIIFGETFAQDRKTVESKVTDLLSRMPTGNQQMTGKLMGDMLSLGESGLKMICDKVIPVGMGNDAIPRFAIENFSGFLSGKNMGSDGAMWEKVCISFASRQNDIGVKDFFIGQLHILGGNQPAIVLKIVLDQFENGNPEIRDVCFKILSEWHDNSALTALYEICASGDKTYEGPAFENYVRLIRSTDLKDEQKLLLFRKIMPFALSADRKNEVLSELSKLSTSEGFTSLFNGINLHGWVGDTVAYGVENGLIVTIPSKGSIGNLYTKNEYSDFIIRFEFQLTPAANNGLGIRAPLTGDAAYVGMELQILDDSDTSYANLHPYQYQGSVYGVIPARRGYLKPVGEWNYEEVTAKGDHIKIILNGTTIVDGDISGPRDNGTMDHKEHPGLKNRTGHIGFLGHGSLVKFRSIWIKDLSASASSTVKPPEPFGPVPSARQLAWHEMEYYMFVHFTVNTFTGREWGYGDENESIFNPTELDCRQWARVARDAGMKGIIITAKHHDGFCLWPSEFTNHSVKNSTWRNGKGDVIKELRSACDEYGLKLGVYLSPWDRNSPFYGTPEYLTYYRNQLRELLTRYGDIFEVWFDGANGGDGYYGGARETRKIDNKTYYDWTNTHKIVRELQPSAVMFSDAGPDIRWVGNENGLGSLTNWCLLKKDEMYPGGDFAKILGEGHEDGNYWVPAEVDVSIRPGWFYHQNQDSLVRSPENLLELYYSSVGRNSNLLLNVPPDRRGLLNEKDIKSLLAFRDLLKEEFKTDIARGKEVVASSCRDKGFEASNINDGNPETYWTTNDLQTSGELVIKLGEEMEVNRIIIQEYIKLGQRVQEFKVLALINGDWNQIIDGTTIGHKIIRKFHVVKTSEIKVTISKSKACPLISNVELYKSPGN
jgi:alpha-L-fucosidase